MSLNISGQIIWSVTHHIKLGVFRIEMFLKLLCLCWVAAYVTSAPPIEKIPSERLFSAAIPIVSQSEEFEPNGKYKFSYETGNGIKREETSFDKVLDGKSKSNDCSNEGGEDDSDEIHVQQGSYSYTAPDGTVVSVRYIADENGFRPISAGISTNQPSETSPYKNSFNLNDEVDDSVSESFEEDPPLNKKTAKIIPKIQSRVTLTDDVKVATFNISKDETGKPIVEENNSASDSKKLPYQNLSKDADKLVKQEGNISAKANTYSVTDTENANEKASTTETEKPTKQLHKSEGKKARVKSDTPITNIENSDTAAIKFKEPLNVPQISADESENLLKPIGDNKLTESSEKLQHQDNKSNKLSNNDKNSVKTSEKESGTVINSENPNINTEKLSKGSTKQPLEVSISSEETNKTPIKEEDNKKPEKKNDDSSTESKNIVKDNDKLTTEIEDPTYDGETTTKKIETETNDDKLNKGGERAKIKKSSKFDVKGDNKTRENNEPIKTVENNSNVDQNRTEVGENSNKDDKKPTIKTKQSFSDTNKMIGESDNKNLSDNKDSLKDQKGNKNPVTQAEKLSRQAKNVARHALKSAKEAVQPAKDALKIAKGAVKRITEQQAKKSETPTEDAMKNALLAENAAREALQAVQIAGNAVMDAKNAAKEAEKAAHLVQAFPKVLQSTNFKDSESIINKFESLTNDTKQLINNAEKSSKVNDNIFMDSNKADQTQENIKSSKNPTKITNDDDAKTNDLTENSEETKHALEKAPTKEQDNEPLGDKIEEEKKYVKGLDKQAINSEKKLKDAKSSEKYDVKAVNKDDNTKNTGNLPKKTEEAIKKKESGNGEKLGKEPMIKDQKDEKSTKNGDEVSKTDGESAKQLNETSKLDIESKISAKVDEKLEKDSESIREVDQSPMESEDPVLIDSMTIIGLEKSKLTDIPSKEAKIVSDKYIKA